MTAVPEPRIVQLRRQALGDIERFRFFAGQHTDEATLHAADARLLDHLEGLYRQPLAAEPPQVTRVGLGYRAIFSAAGVEMTLNRIRESRGEVHGELTVCLRRGATDFADGHLFSARFNVSSLPARTSAAKYLDGRVKGDWAGLLERFCLLVLREERSGEAFEQVGQRPSAAGPAYLLEPMLPQGKATILFGAGGACKSTLAAGIAVALVTEKITIPDMKPARREDVLVADYEDGPETWNERLRAISEGIGAPAPSVHYRAMTRPLADDLEAIAAHVTEQGIALLIVDSLGLATGATRDGESVSDGAFRLFQALRELGTTSLLIDHVAGADLETSRPTAKPYGSVYKLNLARSAWELRRESESNTDRTELLLVHTKANASAREAARGLAIVRKEGKIRFEQADVEAPDLVASLSVPRRMVRLLGAGAQTDSFIANELRTTESYVRSILTRDKGRRFARTSRWKNGLGQQCRVRRLRAPALLHPLHSRCTLAAWAQRAALQRVSP